MADDIVTRLREVTVMSWDGDEVADPLTTEAADEIEWLRFELAGVRRHFLQVDAALSDIQHLTSDRNVLHRIKEARRG